MEICQGTIAVIHPREGFDPALHREFHRVPGIHHVIVGLIMGLAKIRDPFNPQGSIRDMPKHPGPRGSYLWDSIHFRAFTNACSHGETSSCRLGSYQAQFQGKMERSMCGMVTRWRPLSSQSMAVL